MGAKLPVLAAVVAFTVSVSAYVVMSALHLETGPFITFLALMWGSLGSVGGIAAWRNSEIIKEQTNGPLNSTHENVQSTQTAVTELAAHVQVLDERLGKAGV